MEPPQREPRFRGQIRVGRIVYVNGKPVHPKFPGYDPIVVMTKCSAYGELGPYLLKDEQGHIMENVWQSARVHPYVPAVKVPFAVRDPRIVWEHHEDVHVDDKNEPNEAYWAWREKLINNPEAVRYPVGNNAWKRTALYALKERGGRKLDYATSRREIYLPLYARLVRQQPKFQTLIDLMNRGHHLLIIEVDGPHQEAMSYYKEKYGVPDDWIEMHSIQVTPENMEIMISDTKFSFGHGYCLAMALMDMI